MQTGPLTRGKELGVGAVRVAEDEMIVVHGGAVRNDRHIIRFGHGRDPARGGQTAAPLNLGLDDIGSTAFDDLVESLVVVLEISSGELDGGDPFPQVSILAGGPTVLEWVLKPLHIVLTDPLRQSGGELHVPREVAVDHDLHAVT